MTNTITKHIELIATNKYLARKLLTRDISIGIAHSQLIRSKTMRYNYWLHKNNLIDDEVRFRVFHITYIIMITRLGRVIFNINLNWISDQNTNVKLQ